MSENKGIERFFVLFLPWALATMLDADPYLSYLIAWLGSFFIFTITMTGWVKPIPKDRSLGDQLMRPLFIMHIIFAGYMCCTSFFYFLNVLGYNEFQKCALSLIANKEKLMLTAQCQRYYCLAHASFIMGVLTFMRYPSKKKFYIENAGLSNLIMRIALISFPVSIIFLKLPGLSQFYIQLNSLSFIAGTLALAFAIPLKKSVNTIICSILYLFNFYAAATSGFKEPIIISILVLGIFLYPSYKKVVTFVFAPVLFLLFLVLPTYVNSYRQTNWSGDVGADEAAQLSIGAVVNDDNETTNWDFLVYRLSEIDMFETFAQSTPQTIPFYGLTLLKQSLIVIVPRIFWRSKPITEELVMQRVYDAGVANRLSNVSAKPAFVVDSYLSGGAVGILISLFAYGAIAQLISNKAEELFGGYILGSALIFSGLFQIFWRGLSFEFIINSVFWSYITMMIVQKILLRYHILKKV